jgi:hypothetical protein
VNLDAALRAWPHAEKPEEEWEERAQSVIGRLRRGERGATAAYVRDEDLTLAPLGLSSEDGHNSAAAGEKTGPQTREGTPMTMQADRERDRRSLKDLAKMASGLTPPPPSARAVSSPSGVIRAAESKADDSGIVDLAAAAQSDPYAAARAQQTPLASQGLFEGERHPQHGPQSQPYQPAPSVPPPSGHYATPSAPPVGPAAYGHLPYAAPRKASGGNGAVVALVFGGLLALSGAAAGGFFYMKARSVAAPVAVAPAAPPPVATVAAPPATVAPPPAAEAKVEPPVESGTPAATPSTKVAMAARSSAPRAAAAKPGAPPQEAPAKAEAPAPKDNSLADRLAGKPADAPAAAAPAAPPADLGSAMKKEVGDEAKEKPAAHVAGSSAANVPQKPSQGAVTGALGGVLPGARSCLGPDDPISRASVVFGSDGNVQSVTVSGGAQGKPAEACIKSALQKAKLQPFAEPTYTANITIRHN